MKFNLNEDDYEFMLNNGLSAFEALRNKTVLVTGPTSFVGYWMLKGLFYADVKLKLNIKTILITRSNDKLELYFSEYFAESKIKVIIEDLEQVKENQLGNIDYVVHLATYTESLKGEDQLTENIDMFFKFWQLIKNKGVSNFLFTSSGAVYGKNKETLTPIKESDPISADFSYRNTGYGLGKIGSEFLGYQLATSDNITFNVARLFTFSGAALPLSGAYAIGNFVKNIITNEDILIKNAGNVYRSYLYGAELSVWLWHILVFGKNDTFNVGSGNPVTLLELATQLTEIYKGSKVIIAHDKVVQNDSYIPAVDKIKQILNLEQKIDLITGINKMIESYK